MNYLSPQFYIKSTSDEGHIEGYASVFGIKDEQGDTVAKGAFEKSINKIKENGKMPKFLWQHDPKNPIGIWEEVYEDDHGLFVKGKLLLDLKKGKEVYSLLKNKAIDGLSIGYKTSRKSKYNSDNTLNDIDLMEISVVTFPACVDATVDLIKSEDKKDEKNNETEVQIDAFAEIVKMVSKLTQTIYALLK